MDPDSDVDSLLFEKNLQELENEMKSVVRTVCMNNRLLDKVEKKSSVVVSNLNSALLNLSQSYITRMNRKSHRIQTKKIKISPRNSSPKPRYTRKVIRRTPAIRRTAKTTSTPKRIFPLSPNRKGTLRRSLADFNMEEIRHKIPHVSRRPKKRIARASGRLEAPIYVPAKKMSVAGNIMKKGYAKFPGYMWSVSVRDLRKRKYFRSEKMNFCGHFFVMKIISRGERGKRHVELYVEYLPEEEKKDEETDPKTLLVEMSACLLNSEPEKMSRRLHCFSAFDRKNLSFGWSFFGQKSKILRKVNGFVFDDKTVCFDFKVNDLVYQNQE